MLYEHHRLSREIERERGTQHCGLFVCDAIKILTSCLSLCLWLKHSGGSQVQQARHTKQSILSLVEEGGSTSVKPTDLGLIIVRRCNNKMNESCIYSTFCFLNKHKHFREREEGDATQECNSRYRSTCCSLVAKIKSLPSTHSHMHKTMCCCRQLNVLHQSNKTTSKQW